MRFAICRQCGRVILYTAQCYFCDNTDEFSFVESENPDKEVEADFLRICELIDREQYDEAYFTSYKILEWSPKHASTYWMRMLARNRYQSTRDMLLFGGVSVDDPDFQNAISNAKGYEKDAYSEITYALERVREAVTLTLIDKRNTELNLSEIEHHSKNTVSQFKNVWNRLVQAWKDLETIEVELSVCEAEQQFAVKEYRDELRISASAASEIYGKANRMTQCTENELREIQFKLAQSLQRSEMAKAELEAVIYKNNFAQKFNNLSDDRDSAVKRIKDLLSDLERDQSRSIKDIETLKGKIAVFNAAISDAKKQKFDKAKAILGDDVFRQVIVQSISSR